jgi:hypothetical protein
MKSHISGDISRKCYYFSIKRKRRFPLLIHINARHAFHFLSQNTEAVLFKREIKTFSLVLTRIHALLKNVSPEPFSASALCSSASAHPSYAIVMEDLKAQGFSMAERIAGLDMNHCLLVMRQLARYHAASAVIHEKEPEHFREFLDSLYVKNPTETTERIFKINAENLANEVEKWPDHKERFYEKLLKIADNAYTYFADSVKRDEEEFNVLCHGDLWLNNMMFRYSEDTGEVANVR